MRLPNLDTTIYGTMRAEPLIALLLIPPFISCGYDHDAAVAMDTQQLEHPIGVFDPLAGVERDLLDFNILQSTCALYVALRSSAWEGQIAFGRDMDDSMVHWNMCPGGTMVACAVTPMGNGDRIITGIPWPYPPTNSY